MKASRRHSYFSPLARRLILAVFLFSTLVTVIITGLQLYHDYARDLRQIQSSLDQIEQVHLPSLTRTLWATNQSELQLHLAGIIRMRDMQYASVRDGARVWAEAGTPKVGNVIEGNWPLIFEHRGQPVEIGRLRLVASLDGVYARLIDKAVLILIGNAVKTFFVALFIFLIFHQMVNRHLTHIAEYLMRLRFPQSRPGLQLARSDTPRDVLDEVVDSLNTMTGQIHDAYNALFNSEQRYRAFLQQFQGIAYELDVDTLDPVLMHGKVLDITGYESDDFLQNQRTWDSLIQVQDRQSVREQKQRLVRDAPYQHALIYRIQHADGSTRWVSDLAQLVRLEGETNPRLYGVIYDITELKSTQESLLYAKENVEVTLSSIGEAVISVDAHGRITYINPVAENLFGKRLKQIQGESAAKLLQFFKEDGALLQDPVMQCLQQGKILQISDNTELAAAKERLPVEMTAAPIVNNGQIQGCVLVMRDVSNAREMARQLLWQASHDAMTGLINRHEFEKRLQRALNNVETHGYQHALLYIDLDQFKVVNDTCGHRAGDELLNQLGQLMHKHLRARDTLARLGGDEFGVLLEHCSLDQALFVSEKLRDAIREYRFHWENRVFEVSVSIGLVSMADASQNLSQVMAAADIACYAAKESGRNRMHVYQLSDEELAKRHNEMLWVTRLQQAIKSDSLVLYAQPIVPVHSTAQRRYVELLVRLAEKNGGLIAPGAFIPAAERYNLMPAIDRWVINAAFSSMANLPQHEPNSEGWLVGINLSGTSLSEESMLDFVREKLDRYEVNPRHVCFEITETAAVTHLRSAARFIQELKQLGCLFALDDFGSGLSSFGYLRDLPVDFLKIDGSIVRSIDSNPVNAAMVIAINDIGHVMGLKTIAEFVESDAIRNKLERIGVDYLQGYAVAMPAPFSQVIERSHPLALLDNSESQGR